MLRPQKSGSARRTHARKTLVTKALLGALVLLLASCGGGGTSTTPNGGQQPDPVAVDLPIAYIKRPIPVDEDGVPVFPALLKPTTFNPGAAIYLKDRATVTTAAVNITATTFAEGALYDVKDLSVSADGKKLLFAMHPPMRANVTPANQPKWQIWEYTLSTKVLRPIITSTIVAQQGDDLPALPAHGGVDEAEFFVMPEPAVDSAAREVAGDEEIDCGPGVRAEGDGDESFPKAEDAAGPDGGGRKRDADYLEEDDSEGVGEGAEPAELLEVVVILEKEIGEALHGFSGALLVAERRAFATARGAAAGGELFGCGVAGSGASLRASP